MSKPFCASSPEAQAMSDREFWANVYPQPDRDEPDLEEIDWEALRCVGFCLRCGGGLYAEDYQQLRIIIDSDMELCDDCTDELQPEVEETW